MRIEKEYNDNTYYLIFGSYYSNVSFIDIDGKDTLPYLLMDDNKRFYTLYIDIYTKNVYWYVRYKGLCMRTLPEGLKDLVCKELDIILNNLTRTFKKVCFGHHEPINMQFTPSGDIYDNSRDINTLYVESNINSVHTNIDAKFYIYDSVNNNFKPIDLQYRMGDINEN